MLVNYRLIWIGLLILLLLSSRFNIFKQQFLLNYCALGDFSLAQTIAQQPYLPYGSNWSHLNKPDCLSLPAGSWLTLRTQIAQQTPLSFEPFWLDLIPQADANVLLREDLLWALSQSAEWEQVIQLYKQQEIKNPAVKEAVGWAYWQQSPSPLDQLTFLLPTQLTVVYANYQLALTQNNQEQIVKWHKLLVNFPIEAVLSHDKRWVNEQLNTVLYLYQTGIWDEAQTQRVIHFFIWQYPESSFERIFIQLPSHFPIEKWQKELSERRKTVFFPPVERLIDNQLPQGNFAGEENYFPAGWAVANYFEGSSGWVGLDFDQKHGRVLRIDVLTQAEESRGFIGVVSYQPGRGSYVLSLEPSQSYQITGWYKTGGESEESSIYIGNANYSWVDKLLPPTNQQWQSWVWELCYSPAQDNPMQFVTRLTTEGQVWFSQLAITPMPNRSCP